MSADFFDRYLPAGFEFGPRLPSIIRQMSPTPMSERRARRLAAEVKAMRRGL
jgi:hypothetical protein